MDIAIGIYPQKRNCNTFIETYIKLELPILNDDNTGVLRSSITIARGSRFSTVVFRPATIRAAQAMCVLFGLFNYLSIYRSGLRSTYFANKYGCSFFSLLKVPSLFCFYIFSISFILWWEKNCRCYL